MASLESKPPTEHERIDQLLDQLRQMNDRIKELELITEPDTALQSISVEQEIREIKDANLKAAQLLAGQIAALEERQRQDEQKFKRIIAVLVALLVAIASGTLGLKLTDENQERLQAIAYVLIAGGGVGAFGIPFAKEPDDS